MINSRGNPMYWSFSAGVWFMTRVRVSWIFPLFFLILWVRWEDPTLAAVFAGLMFVSVLMHEFGHVVAARMTGGTAHEVIVWPLGGLSQARPDDTTQSQLLTLLGGPFVNLILCAISFYGASQSLLASQIWNPIQFPLSSYSELSFDVVMVILFWVNWIHLLLNLIPIFPFDGGGVARLIMSRQMGREASRQLIVGVGILTGTLAMLLGWTADLSSVVLLGAVVAIFNMQQAMPRYESEYDENAFSDFDYSQSDSGVDAWKSENMHPQKSWWQRWKQRRAAMNAEKARLEEESMQEILDTLLQKVHEQGMSSLSADEKRQLQKASDHMRHREESSPKKV